MFWSQGIAPLLNHPEKFIEREENARPKTHSAYVGMSDVLHGRRKLLPRKHTTK